MIPAFHDYSLETKITKCGDLLYSCYIHGTLHIFYEQNFLFVKIVSWNIQYISVWFRIFLCGIKVVQMSWNFVRFQKIINPIDAEDFWFLSWQTKKAMYYTQWHEILSKVAFIKYFILKNPSNISINVPLKIVLTHCVLGNIVWREKCDNAVLPPSNM